MKVGMTWTIDLEIINSLKDYAKNQEKNESWVVNDILKKFFERRKNGFRKK